MEQIDWSGLVDNLGGIVLGLIAGIGVLILEYRTGFFIGKKKPYTNQQVFKYGLVGVSDKHKGDVEVFYKSRPVTNWGNIVIEFGNDGRQSIKFNDFEQGRPIQFTFPEDTIMLSEPEITKWPENLRVSMKKVNDNVVEIAPLTLNQQEYFKLNILAENPQKAELDVRIDGISEVVAREKKYISMNPLIYIIFLVIIGMVYGIFQSKFSFSEVMVMMLSILGFIIGVVMLLYLLIGKRIGKSDYYWN